MRKLFKSEAKQGMSAPSIWDDSGLNQHASAEMERLFGEKAAFETPKPEALMQRILHIATNPNDLVLDSFLGSGTTAAVAHKMGRRWIMVELGEHCHTHILPRLRKVVDGEDPGGVTEATGWQGGGGFRYYRLAPSLMEKDDRGHWVISKQYNPAMLVQALCKHENFRYEPDPSVFWKQGRSTERDFLYVTTQTLTDEALERLSREVGPTQHLLVFCAAHRGDPSRFENLTVKKIPHAVLGRCEWNKDDYSLKIAELGPAPEAPTAAPEAKADAAARAAKPRKGSKSKVPDTEAQPSLFGGEATSTKQGA